MRDRKESVEVAMGEERKSPGADWLLHRRKLPNRPRLSGKAVGLVKDSILGIMFDMMKGHYTVFLPVSIHDVRLRLRRDYDMFLTYRQVGYFMRQLVREGILEKEVHNVDRTARHWVDQYSQYRFTERERKRRRL